MNLLICCNYNVIFKEVTCFIVPCADMWWVLNSLEVIDRIEQINNYTNLLALTSLCTMFVSIIIIICKSMSVMTDR